MARPLDCLADHLGFRYTGSALCHSEETVIHASVGPSSVKNTVGVMTGASGATSTFAIAACCAHHVTDVLPILGLTAAATFLTEYRTAFMLVGLGTTLVGIVMMLVILFKERRKAIHMTSFSTALEAE